MSKVKLGLAALVAVLSLAFVLDVADAQTSDMTFQVKSTYQYKVEFVMYSSDRKGHQWPAPGKVYMLDNSQTQTYKIGCLGGEKICYGAWVAGNSNRYWGVGKNSQRCEKCCYTCNHSETPVITLQ